MGCQNRSETPLRTPFRNPLRGPSLATPDFPPRAEFPPARGPDFPPARDPDFPPSSPLPVPRFWSPEAKFPKFGPNFRNFPFRNAFLFYKNSYGNGEIPGNSGKFHRFCHFFMKIGVSAPFPVSRFPATHTGNRKSAHFVGYLITLPVGTLFGRFSALFLQ